MVKEAKFCALKSKSDRDVEPKAECRYDSVRIMLAAKTRASRYDAEMLVVGGYGGLTGAVLM